MCHRSLAQVKDLSQHVSHSRICAVTYIALTSLTFWCSFALARIQESSSYIKYQFRLMLNPCLVYTLNSCMMGIISSSTTCATSTSGRRSLLLAHNITGSYQSISLHISPIRRDQKKMNKAQWDCTDIDAQRSEKRQHAKYVSF